jgi:hypothetical protein
VRIGSTICVGTVDLSDGHRRSVGLAIVTYMFLDSPKAAAPLTGTSLARPRPGAESR